MLALYILTAIHALYKINYIIIGGKHEETRRDETITRRALSTTLQGQTINPSTIQK